MAVVAFFAGFVLYFFLNNYPTVFGAVYELEPSTANFYGSLNGLFATILHHRRVHREQAWR